MKRNFKKFMNDNSVKQLLNFLFLILFILISNAIAKNHQNVVFLPFDDRVQLKEAWDLEVDVPKWFSRTIDTIAKNKNDEDFTIKSINFDSIQSFLKSNQWESIDFLEKRALQKIAKQFNCNYIITGKITSFYISRKGISTDAELTLGMGSISTNAKGSVPTLGNIQSVHAKIKMVVSIYDGESGALLSTIPLDSDQRDGSLSIITPFQRENAENDYYYLSRTEFGSAYFNKSIAGEIMRDFCLKISASINNYNKPQKIQNTEKELKNNLIEGKILERSGKYIYIDLGLEDKILKGETFEIYRPDHPIKNAQGDTLGWAETLAGTAQIHSIKSSHFSMALILSETDTIRNGWVVRPK